MYWVRLGQNFTSKNAEFFQNNFGPTGVFFDEWKFKNQKKFLNIWVFGQKLTGFPQFFQLMPLATAEDEKRG